ncbi:dihydropteroate synthase, partial [Amylibacter sp.]|nr:dihydropteroate synthase [Amylibacter sp.]
GSIAVGLEGLRQGVQMLRVHDVKETVQAVRLFEAIG